MQARWPGLVAAARSSVPTSKGRTFYEFAPLPGGHFLVGVGHEPCGSDDPSFLREQILGQLEAGDDLCESVRNVSRTWSRKEQQHGICYALFDPDQATLLMCGSGWQISAIQVTVNSTRLVRFGAETAQGSASHFVLRPGEALLLVAHPRAWDKHVLSVVDRSVAKDLDDLGQHDVLGLCGRIETLLQAGGSACLVIYRMPPDPTRFVSTMAPAGTAGFTTTTTRSGAPPPPPPPPPGSSPTTPPPALASSFPRGSPPARSIWRTKAMGLCQSSLKGPKTRRGNSCGTSRRGGCSCGTSRRGGCSCGTSRRGGCRRGSGLARPEASAMLGRRSSAERPAQEVARSRQGCSPRLGVRWRRRPLRRPFGPKTRWGG